MTGWSISAMLLLGIAAGPYGLQVLSPAVLSLLDPGIVMGLAMLGVFVGLSFNPRRRPTAGSVAASLLRTCIVMTPLGQRLCDAPLSGGTGRPLVGPADCSWRLRGGVGSRDRRKHRRCVDDRSGGARDGGAARHRSALCRVDGRRTFWSPCWWRSRAGCSSVRQASKQNSTSSSSDRCLSQGGPPRIWECPRCSPALSSAPPGTSPGASRKRASRATSTISSIRLWCSCWWSPARMRRCRSKRLHWPPCSLPFARSHEAPAPGPGSATLHSSAENSLIAAGLIGIAIALDIYQIAPGIQPVGTIVGTVVIATIGSNMVGAFVQSSVRSIHRARSYGAGRRQMKRLAGIVLVVAAMVIIREVGPAGVGETRATALALGFALVAALVTGEFLRRFRLPRLTGYLLFGLLIGPYLANVITEQMARQLLAVNGVATTLIAFIAGLTLNFERLERRVAGAGVATIVTLAVAITASRRCVGALAVAEYRAGGPGHDEARDHQPARCRGREFLADHERRGHYGDRLARAAQRLRAGHGGPCGHRGARSVLAADAVRARRVYGGRAR